VIITPLVTRHKGVEYSEMGAGGGQGDLDQIHELELWDIAAVGSLIEFCNKRLHDKPILQQKVLAWLAKSVKQGGQNVRIDTTGFFEALYGDDKEADALDDAPLDRLINALEVLLAEKPKEDIPLARRVVSGLSQGLRDQADRPITTDFSLFSPCIVRGTESVGTSFLAEGAVSEYYRAWSGYGGAVRGSAST